MVDILPHWQFIDTISADYPNKPNYQEVQNYKEFFVALQYVIPCPHYRKRYVTYLITHPVDYVLDNRTTLLRWVSNLNPKLKHLTNLSVNEIIWKYLFMICLYYPIKPTFQEVLFYKNFFITLQNVLPKEYCRSKYVQQFNQIPIDGYMSSRQSILNWIILLHTKIINNSYTIGNCTIENFTNFNSELLPSLVTTIVLILGLYAYTLMRTT